MRAGALLITGVLAMSACTSTTSGSSTSPSATAVPSPTSESLLPSGATLADGSPLPDGCGGTSRPTETVGFVADGRAWAMDPATGTLACLFRVKDPGPFAFGPQGDRVLLDGLQVRGLSAAAPSLPSVGPTPSVFDWGHPLGLAIVYSDHPGQPEKRFLDDGRVEQLSSLPEGSYQGIAYHPSGLALGFIVDEGERQGIWISDNEGNDAQRLVFSRPETVFSSLAFSPDGQRIWWIAQHPGTLSEIHDMDLADRTGFGTILSRGLDDTAHGLQLAPAGRLQAATNGTDCAERQAMVVDTDGASPAVPGASGPTESLGWLDASTLLVAEGGCGEPTSLLSVAWHGHTGQAMVLVRDVDTGAPRTVLHDAPTRVPAPPHEAPPAPPGGVG